MSYLDLYESSYESSITNSDSNDEIVTHLSSSPFYLEWAFGFNPFAPVINLNTRNQSFIAYACSHVTVLYDYKSRKMFKLQGHRNCVRMLSADQSGQWLLTADFDNDLTVVIWDTEKRIPIFTLFNPHEDNRITAASLSPDAKYIVTVGNEDVQLVKIWFWTFGGNTPDAEINLTEIGRERVKDIDFDCKNPNSFALTTDSRVIFIQMDDENTLIVDIPSILKKPSGLGIFNNTAFISNTTKAFTGTKNGFVLVWDRDTENDTQGEIKMIHIKSIPLQKANITKIVNCSSMVVTGNSRGDIIIYNSNLEILYACRDCGLDFIISISFDIQYEDRSFDTLGDDCDDHMGALNESSTTICKKVEESQECPNEISSNVTIEIERPPKPKNVGKTCSKKCSEYKKKFEKFQVPRDASLQSNKFSIEKFIVATKSGKMAWIDIPSMKCRQISNHFNSPVTALDVHPQNNYFVAGDENGTLFLIKYSKRQLMLSKNVPTLPKLLPILNAELIARRVIHVTNADIDENEKSYPSAIKYSPNADAVICGMKNGVLWVLHPDTFDTLDALPYRHSETAIIDVVFSACSDYMAYYDDSQTVAVFKRHRPFSSEQTLNYYDFIGKYRSHNSPIKCILFGSPFNEDKKLPRFLSLGEDKELVEYDLAKSGSYPDPGLVILEISRGEDENVPCFMDWYPKFGVEKCLVISNSEHKLKLINAENKKIKATFLGPTFDSPIKKMIMHQAENGRNIAHMVFATDRQIGLQLLPLDGNPYKILAGIGHPQKITWMRASHCGNLLFTTGQDDRNVLMWKINYKSVEITNRLGGTGLTPFYSLIDGGKEGWLFQEMQDLFVYAQILEQGKNSMKARRIDDEVSIEQLPNLMRAVGFYPSDYQMENLLNEVIYKDYADNGKLTKRITFEEFTKLYINHRPTFGISMEQLKCAFIKIGGREKSDDFSVSKQQFLQILCKNKNYKEGDSLSTQEICKYLQYLLYGNKKGNFSKITKNNNLKDMFKLLPNRISYKDFAANVMGIKSSKETRADCK